ATGHTAFYQPGPPGLAQPGNWVAGPDLYDPAAGQLYLANDAPASLMPDGKVLCVAGPAGSGGFADPTYFFELDGNNLNRIADPPNNGSTASDTRMLLLPTGQVLFSSLGLIYAYTGAGAPSP